MMCIPILVGWALNNPSDVTSFSIAAAITLFLGTAGAIITREKYHALSIRQAFMLTSVSWVILVAFAAIPFCLSDIRLSYTDAFFESMSGLTTTGATVITELKSISPGLLIWRGILQWIGGIGIIVTSVAVLPMLRVGGMQLFRIESSDTAEKILPRATQIAASFATIYLLLTALCALFYLIAGMRLLDAAVHSMTTIATGGFANHDQSFGIYDDPYIEIIAITFMIIGSIPFTLYLQSIRKNPKAIFQDAQTKFFITLLIILITIAWIQIVQHHDISSLKALRIAAFNTVSITTGTGYVTTDYQLGAPFPTLFFFFIMFIGGCAGSTACGLKIFRIQIMIETLRIALLRTLYPKAVFKPKYNKKPINESLIKAVMAFIFLFFLSFITLAASLSLTGLDAITALSAAASAIANVGPGLGDQIGPNGNYQNLTDTAKWMLTIGMLLGRLELFTLLTLFIPNFWKV